MWDQLSEESRAVFYQAEEEAGARNSGTICTQDILLALTREPYPDIILILNHFQTNHEKIVAEVNQIPEPVTPKLDGEEFRLHSDGLKALRTTEVEVQQLGRKTICPSHILLGLLGVENGVACKALNNAGIQLEATRNFVRNNSWQA